jgi:hypothetical protein
MIVVKIPNLAKIRWKSIIEQFTHATCLYIVVLLTDEYWDHKTTFEKSCVLVGNINKKYHETKDIKHDRVSGMISNQLFGQENRKMYV